jgi:hypothetical protein
VFDMDIDDEIVVVNANTLATLHEMLIYKCCFSKRKQEDYHEIVYDIWEQYSAFIDKFEYNVHNDDMALYVLHDSGLREYIRTHTGLVISPPSTTLF